jgi:hypothetical protein
MIMLSFLFWPKLTMRLTWGSTSLRQSMEGSKSNIICPRAAVARIRGCDARWPYSELEKVDKIMTVVVHYIIENILSH